MNDATWTIIERLIAQKPLLGYQINKRFKDPQ